MFYSTTLLCYRRLLRPTAVPQCGTYGTLYKLVQAGSSC